MTQHLSGGPVLVVTKELDPAADLVVDKFFEQCPHRMAGAHCDFYTPKDSSKCQLVEARENLQRMLASIPLTDDERAAVDDGQAALDQLLERLADIPTPAGPTARQIGVLASATLLPIIDVRPVPHSRQTH
ncbi:hypothetical protein [Streptomyces glomeratus]|uniref:Uncharacterized protein n=1 Tax=Streptomyces glomeratus TaxID=284452 RepID=A0ABP6M1L9_9ACTN|nr:hypothetical protein [Streptomyces glomeratus]MCF1512420.1 hypothetical protein [Streptomyces glomeratus]